MKRRLFLGTALGGITAACCKAAPALAEPPLRPPWLPKGLDWAAHDALDDKSRAAFYWVVGRFEERTRNQPNGEQIFTAWCNFMLHNKAMAFALPGFNSGCMPPEIST